VLVITKPPPAEAGGFIAAHEPRAEARNVTQKVLGLVRIVMFQHGRIVFHSSGGVDIGTCEVDLERIA
jgi:hypothetical protein